MNSYPNWCLFGGNDHWNILPSYNLVLQTKINTGTLTFITALFTQLKQGCNEASTKT